MAAKTLSAILGNINVTKRIGDGDPTVRGIAYDSRRVQPGWLFFALDGLHTDGHRYIEASIDKGAVAVVLSRELPAYRPGIVYLQVESPRQSLSPVSADFYDNPSTKLDVIGVTGTDGKSTTVYLIHQLLTKLGRKSGFISTVQIVSGDIIEKNHYRQSTPEAPEIQGLLAQMVENGKESVVVEATSHGLSNRTNRLGDVCFKVGVMTNITHEHLEFHGTLENYVNDKANLFRALSGGGAFGVVNALDAHSYVFRSAAAVPVYSYCSTVGGTEPDESADAAGTASVELAAENLRPDSRGTSFLLVAGNEHRDARINLPGLFNVENTLAAVLTVWKHTAAPLSEIVALLPELEPTVGRMHTIRAGQPFEVVVDYAHTPGAFEKLLPAMKAQTAGRLIVLFGSAGERDVEKRSIQGRIASRFCDILILADEDPRGEHPAAVLEEIASGTEGRTRGEDLFLIPDRAEAIRRAFALANSGDTVLLLGKGHEASIIYADGPIPWNEIEVAERALADLGYSGDPTGAGAAPV